MSLEVLGKSFYIPRPSFVIYKIESMSSSPENTFVRIIYKHLTPIYAEAFYFCHVHHQREMKHPPFFFQANAISNIVLSTI